MSLEPASVPSFPLHLHPGVWQRSARCWPPSAAGGTRARRRRVSGPIIIISIDTLRADHLPAYGYKKVRTPAIDALAADGVVFERAYSHAPQTLPAHAAMLSGRLPFETGVRDNVGFTRQGRRAAAAADAARSRLRHRRRRLGVRAAQGHRHRPGIRFLRRRHAGRRRRSDRSVSVAARRRRVGSDRRALARLGRHRRARSCSCTCTSRTSRTRRRSGSREYAPYDGEIAYADEIVGRLVQLPEVAPALRPLDDRAAVRSRRRARRSRRAGARPVPLRRSDPRAADHQAGEQRRRRPARRRDRAAHRPRADDSRSGEGADPRQPARPIAEAAARRHRPAAGTAGLFRSAVRAVSLRLERADGADRRTLPLHQGADAKSSTIWRAIPTSATTSRAIRRPPRHCKRCARRSTVSRRARRCSRRSTRCRPTNAIGCRRWDTSAAGR